jgi:hypothetical protein
MRTLYFKTLCNIFIAVLIVLFCQQAKAATVSLRQTLTGGSDSSHTRKPGRLRRAKKIKKEDDDNEDGVSDDIRARGRQEFMEQRDPKLNRVPVERLLIARQKRDQYLNDVKIRVKNLKPQSNLVKPSGKALSPSSPVPGN